MLRIDPTAPVTFQDLINTNYPILEISAEEFNALPKTTKREWHPPDGWEKTGYLSPNAYMVGHDNFIYWVFHDFVRTVAGPTDDFDRPTTRPETNNFLVSVGGKVVMHKVIDPYDEAEWKNIHV